MAITLVYRYIRAGQERQILVQAEGSAVTCSEGGESLGTYQWAGATLTGAGSLSTVRREAIAALLSAAVSA
jgi:hypothetical protein